MKKINFYLGALAVASTALLSSCFSSDGDDTPQAPTVDIVENTVICTVVPSSNVGDDVEYAVEGEATKGNTVKVIAKAKTLGKYTSDRLEKTITIGDEHTLNVPFVFTLKPVAVDVAAEVATQESVTVYQGKSEEGSASQATTNQAEAAKDVVVIEDAKVEKVAMEVSKTAVANAQSTVSSTAFSVVVVPANDEIAQVPATEIEKVAETSTPQKPIEASTLQAVCQPSGAQFEEPVKITITAPESAGLDFIAKNGDDQVEGVATDNALTISVPHFSAWDFVLRAHIANVTHKQTYETKTAIVSEGNNTINYTSKLGWNVRKKNVLVNAYLVGLLGSSKTVNVNKSVTFKSTGDGKVTYRVISKTVEFDVKSGSATFHVVANAGSQVEIVNVEYNGHSGGNAQ